MSARDPNDMLQEDLEKYRRYRERESMDSTPPALIELALFIAATVVAVAWLAAMFWVPDPLDGTTWMSLGALGMMLTGMPGAAIYWLRRGGARDIQRVFRGVVR